MTAADADSRQRAENVTGLRDLSGRPSDGITESPKVHPNNVPLASKRGPDRVPHPPVGDACVDQHHWQLAARPLTVIGDAVRRIRSHSPPRRRSTPVHGRRGVLPVTTGFPGRRAPLAAENAPGHLRDSPAHRTGQPPGGVLGDADRGSFRALLGLFWWGCRCRSGAA